MIEETESPAKSGRTKRNLGEITIDNAPFSVWLEGNQIFFRRKFKRRVTSISLPDIYSHAEGQLSLKLTA